MRLCALSQRPRFQPAGQVSPDGQFRWDGTQWFPIPPDEREPTAWTRPMQIGAATVFLLKAVWSVVVFLLFVNHDSYLKALQANGPVATPPGFSVDDLVNISMALALAFVIFFAMLEIIGAVGSILGWRWMFWAALVLFAVGGVLSVFGELPALARPATSPYPVGPLIVTVLLGILSLALFAWMLVGVVKYGPWAMRKPDGAR